MTPYFGANILWYFEGLQCQSNLLLLSPEAEGSIILQNIMNYLPNDTVSYTSNTAVRTSNFVPEETSVNVDVTDTAFRRE